MQLSTGAETQEKLKTAYSFEEISQNLDEQIEEAKANNLKQKDLDYLSTQKEHLEKHINEFRIAKENYRSMDNFDRERSSDRNTTEFSYQKSLESIATDLASIGRALGRLNLNNTFIPESILAKDSYKNPNVIQFVKRLDREEEKQEIISEERTKLEKAIA